MPGIGDAFGGFAHGFSQAMLDDMERESREEMSARRATVEFLIKQASRPDLRPEYRPAVTKLLTDTIGAMGKSGKRGAKVFGAYAGELANLFGSDAEVPGAAPLQITERGQDLPPAAPRTTIFSPYDASGDPLSAAHDPSERDINLVQIGPTPTRESTPTYRVREIPRRGAFETPEEIDARALQRYRGQRQAMLEFDRRTQEPYAWRNYNETFIDPRGVRRTVQINDLTGETREVMLPAGETEQERIARTGAESRVLAAQARTGQQVTKKLDEMAAILAASANEDPRDPKVRERYIPAAGAELVARGELREEEMRAGIEYRRAAAGRTTVETPKEGQPTGPDMRELSELRAQIADLDRQLSDIAKGQILGLPHPDDGHAITLDDVKRDAVGLITKLRAALNAKRTTLEKKLQGRPGARAVSAIPERSGGNFVITPERLNRVFENRP